MPLARLSPSEAKRLVDRGAVLIDVREADERRRAAIPGSAHAPLSALEGSSVPNAGLIVFHCRAGARTQANADRLAAAAPGCEAYVLDGGIEAWRAAGLPIVEDRSAPLEIMRQVQIVAGSLILMGIVLGALVAPGFYGLSAFVGAGLVFAGVTGWCGMAKLLAVMPWNRARDPVPVAGNG